ncbi:MAG: hypothetical protein BRD44_02805 [Bacteroidetes bacterium QS_7_67_15]|nr:MAG: hypothetical protein BRD44_02805 [Bacteroidetes bacterium QS_7_67_15]
MAALSLDTFSRAAYDYEQAQYRVLGGLKRAQDAFSENRIYPHLGRLAELHLTLRLVLRRSEDVRKGQPREIKEVDLENKQVVYEWPELDEGQMADVKALIEWALPHLRETLEEGKTIFEFVDENLRLEEVGLVPQYRREGYLLVPDREVGALHVMQYTLSIFDGSTDESGERYRRLKTTPLKSIDYASGQAPDPQKVKLDLLEERRELPNPATYFFDAGVDFPFEPTVFPIARRKLMRYLSGAEGEA